MNQKLSPSSSKTIRAVRFALRSLFLTPALALAMVGGAQAQSTSTWQGTSGSDWSSASSWSGADTPPASADTAQFNTGGATSISVANAVSPQSITSISFDTAAGSYTIGTTGGSELDLQSGGTAQLLATLTTPKVVETINAPIFIQGAAYTFANNSANSVGTFNIGGAIAAGATSTGTNVLTLGGTNNNANTVSGAISNGAGAGTLGVTVAGGSWTLSGSNTYTGGTTLNTGTLVLQANAGNTVGGVSSAISSGSALVQGKGTTLALLGNVNNTIFAPSSYIQNPADGGTSSASTSPVYNFFVGNNGSGTGNTLILANVGVFGPGFTNPSTFNVSSANGYNLQLGSGSAGTGALTFANNTVVNSNTIGSSVLVPGGFTVGYPAPYTLTFGGGGNFQVGPLIQSGTNGSAVTLNGAGTGTLDLNSSTASTFSGATKINGGTLLLDYTNSTANNLYGNSAVTMNGGTLALKGNATTAVSQTINGLTSNPGLNVVSVSSNSGGPLPTLNLGAFPQNLGSTTEFIGPATIGANNVAVAATGTITTTYIGTGNNNQTAGAGTKGLLWNGTSRIAISTVGLYDWASTDTTAGATGSNPYTIVGGSQVPGFYTTAASGNIVNADDNVDITGNVTGVANGYADTIRFNTNAALTLSVGNGKGFSVDGVLVTPNVGANNTTIATTGTGTFIGENPGNTANTPIEIVQNNTQGELIFTAAIYNSGYSTTSTLDYEQSGPGTVVMTANGANNNFTGTNDYLNGGVTEIAINNALGQDPASGGPNSNTGAFLNLNGGTVLASTNLALDNGATTPSARKSFLGGNGGGFAAVTGATLTVDGVVGNSANGTGPLIIGIPASSANGNVAGLVPGTGTGTANTAVYATGTVTLTGANTYTGGTVIDSGTLLVGSTGLTTAPGALTFNGGTVLLPAPGATNTSLAVTTFTYNGGTLSFTLNGTNNTSNSFAATTLDFNSAPVFSFTPSNLSSGQTYTILSSTNAIIGSNYLTSLTASHLGRLTIQPVVSGDNLNVSVIGAAANLVWAGGVTGLGTSVAAQGDGTTWNNTQTTNVASNWNNGNKYDYFYDADNVTFDNTAVSTSVNLTTANSPSSVTVNAPGTTYTFAGTGSIAGGGSLSVQNGTLDLNTANTYSGGTIIASGASLVAGATGALPSAGTVAVNGNLDLNGLNQSIGSLSDNSTFSGILQSSLGAATLTVANGGTFSGIIQGPVGLTLNLGTLSLLGASTNTGATTINGGTLNLSGSLSGSSVSTTSAGAVSEGATGSIGGTGVTFTQGSTATSTLNGTNTYTGATTVNAGTLTVTGTLGALGAPSGDINVNNASTLNLGGATVYANSLTNNNTNVNISGGSVNLTGALNLNATNTSGGGLTTLTGGTVTAASVSIGRNALNLGTAIQTAGNTGNGLYVNGGTLIIPGTGTLNVGYNSGAVNSSANMDVNAGSVTVGGITTITNNNNGRFTLLDVNGGTFTDNDTTGVGIQIGNSAAAAELLVSGTGVVTTPAITLGGTAQTSGTDVFLAEGGTTYIGSGGIATGGATTTTTTVQFGSTTQTTAPIIAASANWSTSLPIALQNSSTASGSKVTTLQASDAANTGHNITLGGVISGAGGLNVTSTDTTGAGSVTVTAENTYTGVTTVTSGTLYVNDAGGASYTAPAQPNVITPNNTTGSGTGTKAVTVGTVNTPTGASPTLAGSGTITGAVTVSSNGKLSSGAVQPAVSATAYTATGNGLTLTNTLAVKGGATLQFNLGADPVSTANSGYLDFASPDTNSTYLSITGTTAGEVNFDPTSTININLVDLTTAAQTGLNDTLQLRNQTPYLLIQAGANGDYANLVTMNPDGSLAIDGNGYVVGVGTVAAYNPFNITVTAQGSSANLVTPSNLQNLQLYLYNGDLEVVPEPSTWAMMLSGLALLVFWQRARRRN